MTFTTDPDPPGSSRAAIAEPQVLIDAELVGPLSSVDDPELGVNIVDLGLVYLAAWTSAGIHVRMTVTSPSCPMAEMLAEEACAALRRQFPDTAIVVDICRDPPWSPARISEAGRRQLGWTSPAVARTRRLLPWPNLFGSRKSH
jgi:metal-sulfur cluster biosynthetic enzyme